jgi:hypothetical protein
VSGHVIEHGGEDGEEEAAAEEEEEVVRAYRGGVEVDESK